MNLKEGQNKNVQAFYSDKLTSYVNWFQQVCVTHFTIVEAVFFCFHPPPPPKKKKNGKCKIGLKNTNPVLQLLSVEGRKGVMVNDKGYHVERKKHKKVFFKLKIVPITAIEIEMALHPYTIVLSEHVQSPEYTL